MLISCPGCKANFNFDETTIGELGVNLRCFRCRTTFRIVRKGRAAGARGRVPSGDRSSQIVKFVVAHESQSFCEAVRRVVANEPFLVFDSNDGGEAMAIIERVKPDVVLLDVALPTMYGFEICEAMRHNPTLAHTRIMLLAAIYDKRRYRRDPASMYGADAVIEKHRIPDELVARIYDLMATVPDEQRPEAPIMDGDKELSVADEGDWLAPSAMADRDVAEDGGLSPGSDPLLPTAEATVTRAEPDAVGIGVLAAAAVTSPELPEIELDLPEPVSAELAQSFVEEVVVEEGGSVGEPSPPVGVRAADDLPTDHLKARRLARIIVSDIALYNPEKVEEGVRQGSIDSLLADEYAEGVALYEQRVAAEIRAGTDYLAEAWQQLLEKKQREFGV